MIVLVQRFMSNLSKIDASVTLKLNGLLRLGPLILITLSTEHPFPDSGTGEGRYLCP